MFARLDIKVKLDDEKHRNRWRIEYDQIELNDLK